MDKILYIYPSQHSVVQQDRDILSSYFEVIDYHFPAQKKWLIPFLLLHQFIFLLVNSSRTNTWIVSFVGYQSILPGIIGKLLNKNVFMIMHGAETCTIPEANYGLIRKWRLKWAVYISVKMATKVLPVSRHLMRGESLNDQGKTSPQGLFHYFPNLTVDYKVIPNGFDTNYWSADPDVQRIQNLIIAVAKPSQFVHKGINMLIDAAKELTEYNFEIIGSKGESYTCPDTPNVRVLPYMSAEKLRSRFQSAAIYIQPSYWEGFGCALCEAMLCGCYPIVSNACELPAIIGPFGTVMTDFSKSALVQAIQNSALQNYSDVQRQKISAHVAKLYPLTSRSAALLGVLSGK